MQNKLKNLQQIKSKAQKKGGNPERDQKRKDFPILRRLRKNEH